jgi:hypothetical protein
MLRKNKYKKDEEEYIYPNYPYNDTKADAFLTENNNAFAQLCNSYTIIIKIDKDELGNFLPIK